MTIIAFLKQYVYLKKEETKHKTALRVLLSRSIWTGFITSSCVVKSIQLFNYSLQGDQTNSELVQEVDVVQMQK